MNRQEELKGFSDGEISAEVAKIIYGKAEVHPQNKNKTLVGGPFAHVKDYCSNPSDIMPIADKYKISTSWSYGSSAWFSDSWTGIIDCVECTPKRFKSTNNSRLRAICIVYILMMEAKL